jgi:hypothetical protein
MCAEREQKTSPHALEGSIAHALAALCLTEAGVGAKDVSNVVLDDGSMHAIPDNMIEPVGHYVSTVRAMTEGAEWVKVEEQVRLDDVYGIAGQSGTADFLALVGDTLHVHDLKYGRGVRVSANNNKQLRIYAAAAYLALKNRAPIKRILMAIHQPRIDREPSIETIEIGDLLAFCESLRCQVVAANQLYENPLLVDECDFRPTEKGCRWCLYAAECSALKEYVGRTIADDFDSVDAETVAARVDEVKNVDGKETVAQQALGESLAAIPLIQSWIRAVEQKAHEIMLSGGNVDGYKLVLGRAGPRKWVDSSEAEKVLKSMRLKKNQMYDMKVISPTSATKMLKGSKRKLSRLEKLITRSEPKPTIAPVDDPRPAYVVEPFENDFDDLTE